jgi:RNA polymerase sigma factor (sigma-70 family)
MAVRRPKVVPFQRFFDEQAPAVLAFLRSTVGRDDAEECLQETFLAALRAYDGFDGRHPRAWVLTIARRKAIDFRRAAARRTAQLEDPDLLPATEPAANGDGGEIWAEVAGLPPKQRGALFLRFALDLRYREVGAAMGCSEAAARRSVHEGLSSMRKTRTEEVSA